MFGINLPGVTWNSWYNPLDNFASSAKSAASVIPSFGVQTNNGQTSVVSSAGAGSPRKEAFDPNRLSGLSLDNPGGHDGSQPSGGGSSGVQQPSYDVQRYNQAISLLESQLGRLPGQLDIARANINDQFGVGQNQLQSSFNQGQNTYNTQGTQNRQNLVTDRNNINDVASQGLRGLMRMLGAFGVGGSSDRFNAGGAVTNQANQNLAGAGQTFSGNQSALDTNWGNFQEQDRQERRKLDDWKTQQLNSAEQQSLSNRQDILSRLAGLQGDPGASQRYIDEANGLGSQIDALGRFNPSYSGNSPVFSTPTLDSYNVGQTGIQVGNGSASRTTPFLSMLLGDDRRRRF